MNDRDDRPAVPDPPAAGPKLSLHGVQKSFRVRRGGREHAFLALDGIDLQVADQEFVAVIGPSGSGKTTLLKIVAGLVPPDAGEVRIDGTLVREPGEERAMVFQSFGLFPWKTVLDNVAFPLVVRGQKRAEAQATARRHVEQVGLTGFEDAHPHQLSGGMQQRVGLARALAADPEILLMDEPFGAIDAQTRELMQEELLRLWATTRKSVLFITHDLDEAVALSDRVVVLSTQPGRVEAEIEVPLPRPRFEYDVRTRPEFGQVRHRIWSMLKEGALRHQEELREARA